MISEGKARLSERMALGRVKPGDQPKNILWMQECERKRMEWREEGKQAAALGDPLHVMACGLYWGEGAKTRTGASICNSDVHILKKFLLFLSKYFGIGSNGLSFRIFSYTDIKSEDEIVQYWISELGLCRSGMRKCHFAPGKYQSKGNSVKLFAKSAYGTCYITVKCSTRVVQHIYGALEFYSGAAIFKKLY